MRFFLMFPVLFLAACMPEADVSQTEADNSPAPPQLTGDCPAASLQGLVGQTYKDGMVDYGGRIRVIPPGSMVTMDYLPSRLNIDTSADGTITRITCG